MAETKKAIPRHIASGFYAKHIEGKKVIDIGVGRIDTHDGADTISEHAFGYDKDNGDATFMDGVEDETYDTCYISHLMEHLDDPVTAIRNWFRITKPGGIVFISVPHRDLYERKTKLPSKWNEDHRAFYLPFHSEPPHTFGLMSVVLKALEDLNHNGIDLVVIDTVTNKDKPEGHANGEYSIEVIISKP